MDIHALARKLAALKNKNNLAHVHQTTDLVLHQFLASSAANQEPPRSHPQSSPPKRMAATEHVWPDAFATVILKDYLDGPTKAALRLCSKQTKALIDTTVTACKVKADDLDAFSKGNWPLRELCLDGSRKESISLPPSVGQLTQLEKLELIECRLRDSVEGLAPLKHFQQLKYLGIENGPVEDPSFPEWFSSNVKPSSLEDLYLDGPLESFPLGITSNFKHLTRLRLTNYDDIILPESIGMLSALQSLTLTSEGWNSVALPLSFSKLTGLQELHLQSDLDEISPLQHLTGLKILSISNSDSENPDDAKTHLACPEFISKLTMLQILELSGHGIHSLPKKIGNLVNLEQLKLRDLYNIPEIPKSIGKLKKCLTHLELSGSYFLQRLPDSLGNLTALRSMHLYELYALQALPESLRNLTALEELSMMPCHALLSLPESFADLILDVPSQQWSLKKVKISDCPNLELSPRARQALLLLKEHGVYEGSLV